MSAPGRGCWATRSCLAISREGFWRFLLGRRIRIVLVFALRRLEEEGKRGPRVLAFQGAKLESSSAIGEPVRSTQLPVM